MRETTVWVMFGVFLLFASFSGAQAEFPNYCTGNDTFSSTPDECVFYECPHDATTTGTLRLCPPGSAVPAGYTSGRDTPCTQSSTKCSLCSLIPAGYQAPQTWYYGRLNIGDAYLYWRQTFLTTNITIDVPPVQLVYYCVDQEADMFDANRIYTSRLHRPNAQAQFLTYQCMENTLLSPDLVIQRQGGLVLNKPSAEQCRENITAVSWFRLLFPFPVNDTIFTLPEVNCPIPDGKYEMVTILDESGHRLCENQSDSTVIVNGSSFLINYCGEASGATHRVTCHRRLLATDLGEINDNNGNMVVISRPHPYPGGHPRMMCMRYYNGGDKIYLSIAIKEFDTLDCAYNVTYKTYGKFDPDMEGASSLELTVKKPMTSTSTIVTMTAASTPSSITITPSTSTSAASPHPMSTTKSTVEKPSTTLAKESTTAAKETTAATRTPITTTITDVPPNVTITSLTTTATPPGSASPDTGDENVVLIAIITTVSVITLLLIITMVIALVMRSGSRKYAPTWLPNDPSKHTRESYDNQSNPASTFDRHATRYHNETFTRKMECYDSVRSTPTPSISGLTISGRAVSGDYTTYITYMKLPD